MSHDLLNLMYAAIDEVNASSGDRILIEKNPLTPLLSPDVSVDSLTFVNLVVAFEEQIHRAIGKPIVLVGEEDVGLQEHPFRTVGSFANYAARILENHQ